VRFPFAFSGRNSVVSRDNGRLRTHALFCGDFRRAMRQAAAISRHAHIKYTGRKYKRVVALLDSHLISGLEAKRVIGSGRSLKKAALWQYWRLENLQSFDEFLERRFPESRRKAYYLMSIHEHLPPEVKRELTQVGWSKGLELAKLARSRDSQNFDCATWLHKRCPKKNFASRSKKN
jgi:hypothetical protein